jgi:hypothetical protein
MSVSAVSITGNLTVSGTTTYVNTSVLNIGDNIITLNADLGAGVAPTENSGIEVNRGSSANVQFMWDETSGYWSTNSQSFAAGNTTVVGNLSITGLIGLDGVVMRDSASNTTSSTAQFALATLTSTYGSADFVVQATQGTSRQLTKLLVTRDSTTAIATEYGTLNTGSQLFTVDTDLSGGGIRLLITPLSATTTVFKTSYDMITA